jgi:RNA recognition motif-containing protein
MLYNEFSKYGEIVDSIVMKNPETGNSRGFGFVTYKENSSAENAVASGSHKIDGKIVSLFLFAFNPNFNYEIYDSIILHGFYLIKILF